MMFLASQKLNEMRLERPSVHVIATTTIRGRFSGKPTCHQKKKRLSLRFCGLLMIIFFFLSWRNTSHCRELVYVWALTAEAASEGKSKDTLKEVADAWCVRKPVTRHGSAQIADAYKHKVTLWIQTRRTCQRLLSWKLCDSRAPCRAGHMNSGTKLPYSTSWLLPASGYRSFSFCVCSARPKIVQQGLQRPSIRQSEKKKKAKDSGFLQRNSIKTVAHMDTAENDTIKQSHNVTSMSIQVH